MNIKKIDDITNIINQNANVFYTEFDYDENLEGYKPGVFGARIAFDRSDFASLCHELAHGIHMYRKDPDRLLVNNFRLAITSSVEVAGESYVEAMTMQATQLEAEVVAIQFHLLDACNFKYENAQYWATVLSKYMPDWVFGGDSEEERIQLRVDLIEQYYQNESQEGIVKELNEMLSWFGDELQERPHL